MKEILDFLKEAGCFYFATIEKDEPKVRPFGFFMEFEGKLYFGMGDYKPCYRQLKANPKFEICAYSGEKWMRLRGTAVFDERPEVNEAAFKNSPFLRDKYTKPGGPRHAPFYVKDGVAIFQDFNDNPWTVKI